MAANLVRDLARMLSPDKPIKMLMGWRRIPRSTVRAWCTGRRRPPTWVLNHFRHLMWLRGETERVQQLDHLIRQRRGEPRRCSGFCVVKERDGPGSPHRDGRNRLGRPRRSHPGRKTIQAD
jgi:hypothetical protein